MSEQVYNFDSASERYEYMAKLFYLRTGMMAPGKDDALSTSPREIREKEFYDFLSVYHAEAAQAHYEKNLQNKEE